MAVTADVSIVTTESANAQYFVGPTVDNGKKLTAGGMVTWSTEGSGSDEVLTQYWTLAAEVEDDILGGDIAEVSLCFEEGDYAKCMMWTWNSSDEGGYMVG